MIILAVGRRLRPLSALRFTAAALRFTAAALRFTAAALRFTAATLRFTVAVPCQCRSVTQWSALTGRHTLSYHTLLDLAVFWWLLGTYESC